MNIHTVNGLFRFLLRDSLVDFQLCCGIINDLLVESDYVLSR